VRITRRVDERGWDRMCATSVGLCVCGGSGEKGGRTIVFVLCCDCRIRRDFDPRFVSIVFSSSCGDGM
jgi:hypothetical protein